MHQLCKWAIQVSFNANVTVEGYALENGFFKNVSQENCKLFSHYLGKFMISTIKLLNFSSYINFYCQLPSGGYLSKRLQLQYNYWLLLLPCNILMYLKKNSAVHAVLHYCLCVVICTRDMFYPPLAIYSYSFLLSSSIQHTYFGYVVHELSRSHCPAIFLGLSASLINQYCWKFYIQAKGKDLCHWVSPYCYSVQHQFYSHWTNIWG